MNALVVYYSRTGVTRTVAEKVGQALGATVEELIDTKNRKGRVGLLAAGKDALAKKAVPIEPMTNDPADFDLVIIGTPVWAGTMSSAVRAFLAEHGRQIGRAALFCTTRVSGIDHTLEAMAQMCGGEVAARMGLRQKAVKKGRFSDAVDTFVRDILSAGRQDTGQ